jgi:hypothetical protein
MFVVKQEILLNLLCTLIRARRLNQLFSFIWKFRRDQVESLSRLKDFFYMGRGTVQMFSHN